MEKKFLDILVCPVTKGRLEYHQDKQELWSRQAKLAYPIKDGIPYMLENEARALSEEEHVISSSRGVGVDVRQFCL